ncbi:MAG TPA: glycosyltransferase family 2 protein, partial [Nocardioides sp.]|nr:glycosyltransferase family 2 protein [Nocardioides sp.]
MSEPTGGTVTRLLQRQILPVDRDPEVFPLYVDLGEPNLDEDKYVVGGSRAAKELNNTAIRQGAAGGSKLRPEQVVDRTRLLVDAGQSVSLASYFNAFPASYWRRWTIVDKVRLTVSVEGAGATVVVNKSLANGNSQRVDSAVSTEAGAQTFSFDLTLTPFIDGGWYW